MMGKTIADYEMLKDRLTKDYGDDLNKWTIEYKAICKIKEVVNLSHRVVTDKIKELKSLQNKN